MTVKLADIPGAFHLPRVDWGVVDLWMKSHVPPAERPQAWTTAIDQWLDALDQALGGNNRAMLSKNLLLFAPGKFGHMEQLIDFAEAGLAEIMNSLGNLATERRHGPIVVLLFADIATYGRYTAPFDPEAGSVQSGGMCFREGFVHIALRPAPLEALQRTMLHEITHACLSHLDLPLWLEEGIAQMAEEAALADWARFKLNSEEAAEIKKFWREHGLSAFWWGQGFFALDGLQSFSYRLAEVLFRVIVSNHKKRLTKFVRRASADDAGDSAARDVFGVGLASLAGQFLGPGNWDPVPPDAPYYVRRGLFFLGRKQFDRALGDFDQAIQLEPLSSDLYTERGSAHSEAGNYAGAAADFKQAIELDPRNFTAHNNLAWNLATAPEDQWRDGNKAIEHSTKACELCDYSQWYCLGTLGAAYAEVGDFEEAQRWTEEAARLASGDEAADCRKRVWLYKTGQPYRIPTTPPDLPESDEQLTSTVEPT